MARGFLPKIELIGEVEGNGSRAEIAWIAFFRAEGLNLVNSTIGGEGTKGIVRSAATRKKISANTKRQIATKGHPHLGCRHSAESKLKMGLAKKGKACSLETRKKIAATLKARGMPAWNRGKRASRETRRMNAEAHKGLRHSAETRRKMSRSGKKAWAIRKKLMYNSEVIL